MSKRFFFVAVALAFGLFSVLGCQEEAVGAPCKPETDKGLISSSATNTGTVDAIETRSVQCETRTCITRTNQAKAQKFSFCSCKCKNLDGFGPGNDGTKTEDLCDCPPNTKCSAVDFPVGTDLSNPVTPPKVLGNYCIPNCIVAGCFKKDIPDPAATCSPSDDSAAPWNWSCKTAQ